MRQAPLYRFLPPRSASPRLLSVAFPQRARRLQSRRPPPLAAPPLTFPLRTRATRALEAGTWNPSPLPLVWLIEAQSIPSPSLPLSHTSLPPIKTLAASDPRVSPAAAAAAASVFARRRHGTHFRPVRLSCRVHVLRTGGLVPPLI